MSTVSQSYGSSKYEPRYQVGDLIRNGLGAVCKITRISRAHAADGVSGPWALRVGFVTYELRHVEDETHRFVINTCALHESIDSGYRKWAYLGPALEAGPAEQQQAVTR